MVGTWHWASWQGSRPECDTTKYSARQRCKCTMEHARTPLTELGVQTAAAPAGRATAAPPPRHHRCCSHCRCSRGSRLRSPLPPRWVAARPLPLLQLVSALTQGVQGPLRRRWGRGGALPGCKTQWIHQIGWCRCARPPHPPRLPPPRGPLPRPAPAAPCCSCP